MSTEKEETSLNVEKGSSSVRKGRNLILGTLFVYTLLVLTHLGEFWPFSIYPMFSQAGNSWTRALVREVSSAPDAEMWRPASLNDIPGEAVALKDVGINQNDVANFVAKADVWDARRIFAMRKALGGYAENRNLLVYRAVGELTSDREVVILLTPFIYLGRDTTLFNPNLDFVLERGGGP